MDKDKSLIFIMHIFYRILCLENCFDGLNYEFVFWVNVFFFLIQKKFVFILVMDERKYLEIR